MRHQHGHRHLGQNPARDTAEDELAQARMPVASHHHEVGAAVGGVGQDHVFDCDIALGHAFDSGLDAVTGQMLAHPGADALVVVVLALLGHHDEVHRLGAFEERHGVDDGGGGGGRDVPACETMLEGVYG